MKELRAGIFVSDPGPGLLNYFTSHLERKIGLERRYLPTETFKRQWKNVVRMLRMDGTTGMVKKQVKKKASVVRWGLWGRSKDIVPPLHL